MTAQANHSEENKSLRPQEGPKRHIITFIVSIFLTALAFFAVAYMPESPFVIPFIVLIGLVQAGFQLYVWMHLDQKGHEFPAIGIWMGVFFVTAFIIVFIYWLGGY